jgi:hypothetical protein
MLGFARPLLIAALVLLAILQVVRLARFGQARGRQDKLDGVPKRPLGLE